jgi:esterase
VAVPEVEVNGVRLFYEERGDGAPIGCIHGAGSSALVWDDAVGKLERLGRVIAWDRRGCARSERPDPYERTSVREHADDAAALLEAVGAGPAVLIGRSYGGTVATDVAIRHPERVRALVLLESDAPRELAPATAEWIDGLANRLQDVAKRDGVDAVGEALITAVAGQAAWDSWPGELQRVLTGNGPAILAEVSGEWWVDADADALGSIEAPVLIVAAEDSPPELSQPAEALTKAIPTARITHVAGGHLIDPASPDVLAFVEEVLARR